MYFARWVMGQVNGFAVEGEEKGGIKNDSEDFSRGGDSL